MPNRPPIRVAISCPCGWGQKAEGPAPSDDAEWDRKFAITRSAIDDLARHHLASGVCALGVLRGKR